MEPTAPQETPKPDASVTPGRIVRYLSETREGLLGTHEPALHVAIIVRVNSGARLDDPCTVNLGVFSPDEGTVSTWGESVRIVDNVPYDREKSGGTWHWPSD